MKFIGAMLVLFPVLALAQIRVCQNGVCDGGIAKQQVNCQEPIECKLDAVPGGAVRIALDSGFASGPSGPRWQTVYDCDFTAQGSMSLDAGTTDNTGYDVCGAKLYSWKTSQTIPSNVPDMTSGGIRIVPAQVTAFSSNDPLCPGFYVKPTDLDTGFGSTTPYRATMGFITSTLSANYDHVDFGEFGRMGGSGRDYLLTIYKAYCNTCSGAGNRAFFGLGWGGANLVQSPNNGQSTEVSTDQNQITITALNGVASGIQGTVDYMDGGAFPQGSDGGQGTPSGPIVAWARFPIAEGAALNTGAAGARIIFCAVRNNSGTAHIVLFKRLKVEVYKRFRAPHWHRASWARAQRKHVD